MYFSGKILYLGSGWSHIKRIYNDLFVNFDEWTHMLIASSQFLSRRLSRQRWTVRLYWIPALPKVGRYALNNKWRFKPLSLCSAHTMRCVLSNWHCFYYVLIICVNGTHCQRARCHADAFAILQHLNLCPPHSIQGYKTSVWSDVLVPYPSWARESACEHGNSPKFGGVHVL